MLFHAKGCVWFVGSLSWNAGTRQHQSSSHHRCPVGIGSVSHHSLRTCQIVCCPNACLEWTQEFQATAEPTLTCTVECTGLWDCCVTNHREHVNNCLGCAGFRHFNGSGNFNLRTILDTIENPGRTLALRLRGLNHLQQLFHGSAASLNLHPICLMRRIHDKCMPSSSLSTE